MKIRKFRKEDARKASNIARKAMREVNIEDYSKESVEKMCRKINANYFIDKMKIRDYFVAVENEKVLGICGLEKNEIHTMFVHPKSHGKGIGKALVERIEKLAKKRKIKKLKTDSSLFAENFYKKLGFKKIKKETQGEPGEEYAVILMGKKLD